MKRLSWVLLAGTLFSTPAAALTPQQCADLIQTNRETIDLLVMTISLNEWATPFLLQHNHYGVWGGQWQAIQLRNENETVTSIFYEFVHDRLNTTIVFGYSLLNYTGIPAWLGQPQGWLYCEEVTYDSFEPLDICCICDEEEHRKRKRLFEDSVDPIKRPLIEHLIGTETGMEWEPSP